MNRNITLVGMLLGLLIQSHPAQAVGLTAVPANPLASGTYNVSITPQGGNVFSVTVTGNNDGRTVNSGGPIKHSVVELSFGFLRGDYSTILPQAAGSGGNTTSGGAYAGANWYTVANSDAIHFDSPGALYDLGSFSENSFSGLIKLASLDAAERVAITLQGGTQQWFAQGSLPLEVGAAALAPEPASIALAVPGLLPLLLLLRRRRH